jgi:hypothetical protein
VVSSIGADYLDRGQLMATLDRLELRIAERFPDSSLLRVCRELQKIARNIEVDLRYIGTSNGYLRGGIFVFVLVVLGLLAFAAVSTKSTTGAFTLAELIQVAESAINDVVFIVAAVVFLVSMEARAKRKRVIAALNRLRSIAHVIDMHQLTKDPSIIVTRALPTEHSPRREMSPGDLARYLDYCSELFALTSKVGFCYVQDFDDADAVRAMNELESLTSDLSRKVWQKIMLISRG